MTAEWIARRLWWVMLWVMRRPLMKRLRRLSWEIWPSPIGRRVKASILGQDRFARLYGLDILTVSVKFSLNCFFIMSAFVSSLVLYDHGVLTMPEHVREQVDVREAPFLPAALAREDFAYNRF
jgi:hypothetical protein